MIGFVFFILCIASLFVLVKFVLMTEGDSLDVYLFKLLMTALWGLFVFVSTKISEAFNDDDDEVVEFIENTRKKEKFSEKEKEKAKERKDDWGKGME